MKKLKFIFLILGFLITSHSVIASELKAQEPIKIKLEYEIPKAQKIKLKVTEIPRIYPWLERADDDSIAMPEIDSTIVLENTQDLKIYDAAGNFFIIPEGTKFYSRLKETKEPKSFWRKGQIKLDFYKISTGNYSISSFEDQSLARYDGKNFIQPSDNQGKFSANLDANALSFDSKKSSNMFKDGLENISRTAGYTITGAVLAPLAIYSLSSGLAGLVSTSVMTNPYVIGGAAAVGGAIGMIYGIKKEGKKFNLEPGKEIELEIANPWLLSQSFDTLQLEKNSAESNPQAKTEQFQNDPRFKLNILEVKQRRDEFGDKAIKISITYENHTNEDLRLSSFKLLDSTGKEYEASYMSDGDYGFGDLPVKGKLDLLFTVDFPNATHYLKVVKQYNQKPIYTTKISFKKKLTIKK